MNREVIIFDSPQQCDKTFEAKRIVSFKFENIKYCITRLDDGSIIAFPAYCPHFDHSLESASINNSSGEVICPWHNYKFSLRTGAESRNRCKALSIFKTYWNSENKLVAVL